MSRIRNFVEPFDLTLPYVLEMIKLVPPMQDVHGGVSIEKANGPDDLQFLMLAYLKQDKNDELRLEVNGTVEDTTSVKEGKETEDTPLYLAPGLLRKGLNRVRILIKRISGNEEATPELVLFYKTSPPGDTPPVMNLSLNHRTIDAANADDVYATVDYNNSQDHDKIFISCNGVIVEHTRLPGDPSPLRIHIPKMKLIEGGVSKTFPFKFRVVDYVRNPSGPPTWSDIVTADVDWNRVSLSPPFLVDPSLNPIDLLKGEQVVTVRVQFDSSIPGQKARLVERYPLPGSSLFAPIEFNQNHRANFKLETSFLVKRRGGPCGLYWELMDGDDVIGESPDLVLDILPIKEDDPRLPTPTIAGVTGPVLEVSTLTDPVLLESSKWPLQKRNQALWITLVGTDKDEKEVSLVVRAGEPNDSAEGLLIEVPLVWFKNLKDASDLSLHVAVNLDNGNDQNEAMKLNTRTYNIKANAPLTVDETLMTLHAIKFLYPYGMKEVTGNVEDRPAFGGELPYTYRSDDPTIASVSESGKVTGLKTGTTTIRITDRALTSVTFRVDVKNVFRIRTNGVEGVAGSEYFSVYHQDVVRGWGGLPPTRAREILNSTTLSANFENVVQDLFGGKYFGQKFGAMICSYSNPTTPHGALYVGINTNNTIHMATGIPPTDFYGMAIIPT
ncbi:Ig-like domain-containing protein [Pseudomonas sp. 14A]|uniref:Ig-like domain-containing protein n=1 Tax=Pseudomonas sp. 14A TaxID=2823142 RepID=UPI001B8106F0|nr:Ig-like domain-containing protein [Pseudomonas sp. 14A]MBR7197633.1 Ig-like domain-containing protein [Pseudomonas sp. 14A]